jgi:hypothetical protein
VPRYHFIIRIPGEKDHEDPDGKVLLLDDDALGYAMLVIRELKQTCGQIDPGAMMVVKDDTQRVVFSIPF